ncbi:MAG: hypothetical protein HPY57_13070 [Ignavibacteria bacterium]|nr:hypothetical protein [Ignavibacteria bacterium]
MENMFIIKGMKQLFSFFILMKANVAKKQDLTPEEKFEILIILDTIYSLMVFKKEENEKLNGAYLNSSDVGLGMSIAYALLKEYSTYSFAILHLESEKINQLGNILDEVYINTIKEIDDRKINLNSMEYDIMKIMEIYEKMTSGQNDNLTNIKPEMIN